MNNESGEVRLIQKIDDKIVLVSKYMSYVSTGCLFIILFVAFFDVVLSKTLGRGIDQAYEIVQYFNVVIVFFAIAYGELTIGHVRIEMLFDKFPALIQKICGVVFNLLMAAMSGVAGWLAVEYSMGRYKVGALSQMTRGFPIWPFAVLLAIGFFSLALAFIWESVRVIAGVKRPVEIKKE